MHGLKAASATVCGRQNGIRQLYKVSKIFSFLGTWSLLQKTCSNRKRFFFCRLLYLVLADFKLLGCLWLTMKIRFFLSDIETYFICLANTQVSTTKYEYRHHVFLRFINAVSQWTEKQLWSDYLWHRSKRHYIIWNSIVVGTVLIPDIKLKVLVLPEGEVAYNFGHTRITQ